MKTGELSHTVANETIKRYAGNKSSRLAHTFFADFLASLVVFLIALPLCLGVAQASGMPEATGIITGVIGGIVVGALAGSPLQVSGPAAGLFVIIAGFVQHHGALMLGPVIVLAGVLQLAAGVFRFGQWFRAVPPAVIRGMLAGIGVLIIASQAFVMLDVSSPIGTGLQRLLALPTALGESVWTSTASPHFYALMLGLMTIALIIGWNFLAPKRWRFIPGTLIAIVAVALLDRILQWPVAHIQVPESLLDVIHFPSWEAWRQWGDPAVIQLAITIAIVASAESLLCATAVDGMHSGRRTRYNRELASQGVGNILCGLLTVLPMTGVIVRSGANVQAGAKTRLSSILHGVWLLAMVVFAAGLLQYVPKCALAAILCYTGFKLVEVEGIVELKQIGWSKVMIWLVTAVTIVSVDLLAGILLGLALAAARLLLQFTKLRTSLEVKPDQSYWVHLEGAATFVGLPRLATVLEEIPPGTVVHLPLKKLIYLDHACLELLEGWSLGHENLGGKVHLNWKELATKEGIANGNKKKELVICQKDPGVVSKAAS